MIEKGCDRGGLSEEEIRELLRDDLPTEVRGPPAPPSEPRETASRVLIVSRRRDEVDLFRERLEARGAAVAVVRNPFGALDRVRAEKFAGVVADLGLWADEGALLVDRLRAFDSPPRVLFLADPPPGGRGEFSERLEREGAAGVLFRPIEPAEVERAAEALLAEPAAAPEEPAERPPNAAEAMWLRFFFEARRALRAASDPRARLRILAAEAAERLRARGAAAFFREGDRPAAFVCGTSGDDAALASIVSRASGSEGGRGTVAVEAGSVPGARLVLVDPPGDLLAAGARFLDELRALLSETVSEGSGPRDRGGAAPA